MESANSFISNILDQLIPNGRWRKVGLDTDLEEVGFDSIIALTFFILLEETYQLRLNTDDFAYEKINTLRHMQEFLEIYGIEGGFFGSSTSAE